jgi:transposase
MEKSKSANRYSAEVHSRAVRMVLEHGSDHASQSAAIGSIAAKIGCTGKTLRGWVRQAERNHGLRAGPTSDDRERINMRRIQERIDAVVKSGVGCSSPHIQQPSTGFEQPRVKQGRIRPTVSRSSSRSDARLSSATSHTP